MSDFLVAMAPIFICWIVPFIPLIYTSLVPPRAALLRAGRSRSGSVLAAGVGVAASRTQRPCTGGSRAARTEAGCLP